MLEKSNHLISGEISSLRHQVEISGGEMKGFLFYN